MKRNWVIAISKKIRCNLYHKLQIAFNIFTALVETDAKLYVVYILVLVTKLQVSLNVRKRITLKKC